MGDSHGEVERVQGELGAVGVQGEPVQNQVVTFVVENRNMLQVDLLPVPRSFCTNFLTIGLTPEIMRKSI